MIRQLYEIGMRVTWTSKSQEKTPIGTIQVHDAGTYRLFTTEIFHLCYKIYKTESIDESHQIEFVVKMPEEWIPFQILSTEEYSLYSLMPLEFGSWSLRCEEDSQSVSEPPPSFSHQVKDQQRNPTSHQPSLRQPQPSVKRVQPSSPSHPKLNQHHSKQRQPALRHTSSTLEKQKVLPSSNQISRAQHQSPHQSLRALPNEQFVPNGQTSLQSQWIPLERLSLSPSSQSSPKQKVKQRQQGHVSEHHLTESKRLHGQPTSHQRRLKHPHRHRVLGSQEEKLSQQPKD